MPTVKYYAGGYFKTDDNSLPYEDGRTEAEFTRFARNLLSSYNSRVMEAKEPDVEVDELVTESTPGLDK